MTKVCKKCGYQRNESDEVPDYECPQCGAIYEKVEAHLKQQAEAQQRQLAIEEKRKKDTEIQKIQFEEEKKKRQLRSQYICSDCGHLGKPVSITKGSILIEIILWMTFFFPGLIYSIWRCSSRYKGCPQCKHESMIPAMSPKGQKLIYEFEL